MKLLHEDASPEVVDVLRVWIFGIWFFKVLIDPFVELSELSPVTFNPAGFLLKFLPDSLKHSLLSELFLYGLKIALILSLACVIFKIFMKPASVLACVLLTLYQGIIRGFGEINHAEIVLLYAAYFFTLFPIADEMVEKKYQAKTNTEINLNSIPCVSTLAFLCFTYTFVGIQRIVRGGWNLFYSDSLTYWILDNSLRPSESFTPFGHLLLEYPLLARLLNVGLSVGTFFEILAPLCLLSSWFRYVFLIVMIPFHIIILFFMGINFWEQVVLYVLLFNLSRWFSPKAVEEDQPVIFFDGLCALCDSFVSRVLLWDRTGIFRFAPLQGEAAKKIGGLQSEEPSTWSIVLVDGDGIHRRSEAVLQILSRLGGTMKLIKVLLWIPRGFRDRVYDFVARSRYRWFGRREFCRLPKPGEKNRFLN